ncbi:ciliogenesis and planar polarity effector 1 isoform X2 [Trichomycterus rosablanca]
MSLCDPMRQRYSVTWHPRLPCLIVSDGYMVTMLKMPNQPSSSLLMSCLLLETTRRLERVHKLLVSEQPQVRARLESMSTLKFTDSLLALKEKEMPEVTLPLFLRDGGSTGVSRVTMEKAQAGDDGSDSDGSPYAVSIMEDGGRLEFASMFDTLHAQSQADPEDQEQASSAVLEELTRVQRSLLTAWALGVSLGGSMDQRKHLLKYTVSCAVRLARFLWVSELLVKPCQQQERLQTSHVFKFLRSLLSFLAWDSFHQGSSNCFGIVLDLTQQFIQHFLFLSSDAVCSSQNFTAALLVLQEASKSLDQTYSLSQKTDNQGQDDGFACSSDMFFITLLQENENAAAVSSRLRNRPSNRLVAVWRYLYTQALQYQARLCSHRGLAGRNKELENMWNVISQIQRSLQSAGDHLEKSPALKSITGEQHFLLGEYSECIQAWRVQLLEGRERSGSRACFLETRYCLALLFGELYQYRLREAQAMCDAMAQQLQSKSSQAPEENTNTRDESQLDIWLPRQVNNEAAYAVVQSLGRFMASYFTNQPLTIFPPHNVDVLPPLHLPQLAGRRMVALSQSQVAATVRSQHLSGVWTVDYALELLLLGGLMPEATWLAQSLGDWKMAASLGLAYTTYCRLQYDFCRLNYKELYLPVELQPSSIFQSQLELLLGSTVASERHDRAFRNLPDIVEVEDMELLQVSVQEILRASVMAEVDVMSRPLTQLLESAKEQASAMSTLVPPALYLPAPPLYCPQPAPNTQDSVGDMVLALEREARSHVAAAFQRLLLLFRAARCSRPAAQWYINGLSRCRRLFSKVRKRRAELKNDIPEGLKKFANRRGFFLLRSTEDRDVSAVAKETMVHFRELCGLCWMLHARDQLALSCRRYQAARNKSKDSKAADNSLLDLSVEVLHWACRLQPFSRFLNAEETLQDLVLSLVAELPSIPIVAEALVTIFPDEVDSVRVPLREKYTTLLQRLSSCTVQASNSIQATQSSGPGEEDEPKSMMLLIQEWRRQQDREQRRLARRLVPVELHLWEREEEEDRGAPDTVLNRLSLGTSLSNSTLTVSECPPPDSESGAADTISEPQSPALHTQPLYSLKPQNANTESKNEIKKERSEQEEHKQPLVPTVGSWRFELEDEEYPHFLELFLSYVLEKDNVDTEESELPLLSCFSSHLHDRELHSDTFDVVTTFKRRQTGRKRGERLPVFRAGSCFHTLPETPEPLPSIGPTNSVLSETHTARNSGGAHPLPGKQTGLFGLRRQNEAQLGGNAVTAEFSTFLKPLPWVPRTENWPFKTVTCPDIDLQLELDSKLEAQFPQLARLLEWMLRWADRNVLLTHSSRKKTSVAGKSAVIRVKSSAPAVLSALRLMQQRYTAGLQETDKGHAHMRVLETELTVTPAVQFEMDWKRQRESSLDTGYPVSSCTPITLPDLDTLHRHSSEMCDAEELEEEQKASYSNAHEDMISDTEIKKEDAWGENEPLASAEPEGDNSVVDTLEVSSSFRPNVSVQIKHRTHRPKNQPMTLEDLKCPNTDEDSSESQSEEVGTLNSAHTYSRNKSADSPVQESPEPTSVQQTNEQILSRSNVPNVLEAANHLQSSALPQNGERNQPDSVRQLLQDELFRLVQLQQINFMSLMQVLGASFANVGFSQANPLLSQLNVPAAQTPAPAQSQAQPPAAPSSGYNLQDVRNTQEFADVANTACRTAEPQPCSTKAELVTSLCEDRNCPTDAQINPGEIQHLTIRSDWSRVSETEGQRFIPPSQGLLTTIENQDPLQLTSSSGFHDPIPTPSANPPQSTQGLRLLKLPPSQSPPISVKQAWPPIHLGCNHPKSAMLRRAEDCNGGAEAMAQQHVSREREKAVRFPSAVNVAVPSRGPQLIRVPPGTKTEPIRLIQVPISVPTRQPTVGTAGTCTFSTPQLLRVNPEPSKTGCRYSGAPVSTPRLIPLEELKAWTNGSATGNFSKPQLLHVDPEPPRAGFSYSKAHVRTPHLIPLEELMAWARTKQQVNSKLQLLEADTVTPSKLTSTPSRKRMKRREEKKKQKKAVSFRPDDSIIPPAQEPESDRTARDDSYAIPLGSFDSMLTGERLLAKAYATSAELHAFAATQKRPPEVQDACINTDPPSPRSTTDKAVLAQLPVSSDSPSTSGGDVNLTPLPPPDMFLNLHSVHPAPNAQNANGQKFVNANHHEGNTSCPSPTSAELHLLAVSVINPAPNNAAVQTEEQWNELTVVPLESEQNGDPVTVKLLTDVGTPEEAVSPPCLVYKAPFTLSQASADLVDMDTRLAALERIADHMDKEFFNMRLLVNTIDDPSPAVISSEEDEPHPSTLKVLKKAKDYRRTAHSVAEMENIKEEAEEHSDRFCSTPNVVPPGQGRRSFLYSAVASTPGSAHQIKTSPVKPEEPLWDLSQELDGSLMELMENSGLQAESTLALTGLSDVADILGDLVKEGALSPSALRLTSSLVRSSSSKPEEQHSRARIEEERKDLRTWMRRKQRERLVEYHKQREEKRENERVPFTSTASLKPTSRDLQLYNKNKEQRDKDILQKHHSQRVNEACSLMTDILNTSVILPTASIHTTMAQHRDSRPGNRVQSAGKNRTPKSRGRARSVSSLNRTVVLQRRGASAPPGTLNNRLGLHRPVSALPGDRLSQVTRRGMLTDLRVRTRVKTPAQRLKPGLNKSPKTVKQQEALWSENREERDVVSPWDVPLEIRRILGLENETVRQSLMENHDDDVLSESTGSILSKLDWAAIERIVAEEGDL